MPEMRVPFMDMQARLRPLRAELMAAYERVLDSGVFVMGPEARALEEEFAAFCGVEHAVAVSNGTAALHLALLALGVGPGDEVITVANTFIATVEAVSAVGATPVLVDMLPDTYLMDPAGFAAAVTPRTKAVIPVHLYGQVCDMDAILGIARAHGIAVVEDACQAHGATYKGTVAGAMGDVACFSFYPGKNVGAVGEGGMLVSRREEIARAARMLRQHGELTRYYHDAPAWNYRLSEILASSVRIQLRHAAAWNAGRRQVAAWYGEALRGLPVQVPAWSEENEHVFHLYVVQVDGRDEVRESLTERGVGTGIHYPVPVHLQRAYRSLGLAEGALPETEAAAPRILSLPMFPEMTREQVRYVAESLKHAIGARRKPATTSAR